ncbi:hypothetical protein KC571_03770 [candidate division WWE3 bacterium]|uniref:Uncharacterized protein n=1 Tax=candidate division WWE3 bacterium TaxID=2053526 RepID=A0A955LHB4_UNCKA|nr:hypothetical protein [candidate division WWE3 bacterium]
MEDKTTCEVCGTEADENHTHCEYCGKASSKESGHTVETEGGQKRYCCKNCCDEHEAKEDKSEKKATECEFC